MVKASCKKYWVLGLKVTKSICWILKEIQETNVFPPPKKVFDLFMIETAKYSRKWLSLWELEMEFNAGVIT